MSSSSSGRSVLLDINEVVEPKNSILTYDFVCLNLQTLGLSSYITSPYFDASCPETKGFGRFPESPISNLVSSLSSYITLESDSYALLVFESFCTFFPFFFRRYNIAPAIPSMRTPTGTETAEAITAVGTAFLESPFVEFRAVDAGSGVLVIYIVTGLDAGVAGGDEDGKVDANGVVVGEETTTSV